MGVLILLPSHPDYPYARINGEKCQRSEQPLSETYSSDSDDTPQLTKLELRAYIVANSIKGNRVMPRRTPFVGETKAFDSPIDPETKFVIRRLSIQQVMLYRDRNSVIRYVTESAGESNERYITERDYPTGTMTLDVATFGLATWNIQDERGDDLKITEDNIKRYLDPEELDFVADKVFEVNPILRGNQKRETQSNSGSSDGGGDGKPDDGTVPQTLSSQVSGTGELSGAELSAPLSVTVDGGEETGKSNDRGRRLSRTK